MTAGRLPASRLSMLRTAAIFLLASSASAEPGGTTTVLDAAQAFREECSAPTVALDIPDGKTASRQEMAAAQAAFRSLDAAVTAYTQCLADAESRLLAGHPAAALTLRNLRAELNDAAIAQVESVAKDYNAALDAYHSARSTPPRIVQMPSQSAIDRCYPPSIARANITVILNVSRVGEVAGIEFSPTISEPVKNSIRCIVRMIEFQPGTLEGQPIETQATLPFRFGASDRDLKHELIAPVLVTSPDAIAALQAGCMPQHLNAGGEIVLSLKLSERGKVTDADVAVSSGNGEVDRVAVCMARRLEFEPMQFRNQPAKAVMVQWSVSISPRQGGE